jgi:hypothetical protein
MVAQACLPTMIPQNMEGRGRRIKSSGPAWAWAIKWDPLKNRKSKQQTRPHSHVHSNFTHDSQNLETAPANISGVNSTLWCAYNADYSKTKRNRPRAIVEVSLKNVMLSERNLPPRVCTDSFI